MALIAADFQRPAAERQKQSERCGAEAVRLLRRAHVAGHFAALENFAWLENGQELDPLRGRSDFRMLLAEVRQAREAAAKGRAVNVP